MRRGALIFWLAVILIATLFYGSWVAWRQYSRNVANASESSASEGQSEWKGTNLPPGKPTPDFVLTDQDGHEFHSGSLRGKVWVASFFFAACPGACYQLNQALAGLQAESDFKDVRFVSITCNPADDTPEVLKEYAARFGANPKQWTFLTGDLKKIQEIGMSRFLLGVAERTHSEQAVVLDKNSTVRGYFHLTDDEDVTQIRIRMRALLAEPAPKNEPPTTIPSQPTKTTASSEPSAPSPST